MVGMPDVACPFFFLVNWFKMWIASDRVTLEIPLLSQPGQVYPVSCSDHCWKKNRVARHVSHISEQGWPYGWLWISLRCWRSVQTGCCQSVNGAQAFQFSHGEVCVTEPRGQTHEAMPVCTLLDTQPHLPPPRLLPWLNSEIWKWKQNLLSAFFLLCNPWWRITVCQPFSPSVNNTSPFHFKPWLAGNKPVLIRTCGPVWKVLLDFRLHSASPCPVARKGAQGSPLVLSSELIDFLQLLLLRPRWGQGRLALIKAWNKIHVESGVNNKQGCRSRSAELKARVV